MLRLLIDPGGRAMRHRRMLSVSVIVLGMVSSAIVLVPAPVMAAANTVLAYWDMNEPPGAITMLDSSTNAINGVIGSAVQTGVAVDGETAYRWSNVIPTAPPASRSVWCRSTTQR